MRKDYTWAMMGIWSFTTVMGQSYGHFFVEDGKPKGERLVLENDGNLVLLANDQTVLWTSGSNRRCPAS